MPFLGTTGGGSLKQFGGQANLGYFIKNSLRFRGSASAYLNRTFGTPSSGLSCTSSGWVKLGTIPPTGTLFEAGTGASNTFMRCTFGQVGSELNWRQVTSVGGLAAEKGTSMLFRDPAAWYHIVCVWDTNNATAADRQRVYVNGSQVTAFGASTDPSSGLVSYFNTSSYIHYLGALNIGGLGGYLDGYLAEINFIDGQALTPSSFGKTDAVTGQWVPKKFAGTYGTNGFYLKFADASAATAAAIGKDSSPNGNNWTPNNISVTTGATYDAMIDSPSLSGAASNYATLNPLDKYTSLPAPTNGNLSQANGGAAWYNIRSTIGVASGKWYAEVTQSGSNLFAGVMSGSSARNFTSYTDASGLYAFFNNGGGTTGYKYANGTSGSSFTIASGDVIGLAYDYDAQTLAIYRNGNLQDTVTSIPKTETMFFCASHAETTGSTVWNFGQRPFSYTPPSGFKSLNTFNLP